MQQLKKSEYKIARKIKPLHKLNWIVSWNTIWTAYFRKDKKINDILKLT